mmetsp:Transcript_11975/g.18196  ORF Transcript_11975/g.18196 Transcript_11975/m.18196 type:complete len:92 (+) Transcript_11975:75-350(+)
MVTKRKAHVAVHNETGENVVTIHVGHKYNDYYKDKKDFGGELGHGQTTNESFDCQLPHRALYHGTGLVVCCIYDRGWYILSIESTKWPRHY